MAAAKVTMCLVKYYVLILFTIFLDCHALNCRSDSGPKDQELKNIYMTCLKRQEGKNTSSNRGYSGDDVWKEPRGYNQRSQWDRNSNMGRDERERVGNRDDRMGSRDSRMGSRDDRMGNRDDRMDSRNDRSRNRDDSLSSRNDRTSNRDDRMSNRDDSNRNGIGARNDMMGTGFGRGDITGRDDFPNDEYGSFSGQEMPYNNYRSSTASPRRFRREKRAGMNSGQRSQYNPNSPSTQKPGREDSSRNDERNSSETNSSNDMDKKACALHCFLENLEMTGDNGMPDRYLVTHVMTKDVKNEDLRDFLQESVEECFQILDIENTENKCEFSMNLLMCLSEKGRANCDDWKDDIQL